MDKEKKISSENINQSQPANAEQTTGKESNRLKPIVIVDTKLSDFVDWLKTISVFKLTVVLGEVAILSGAVSYIVSIPNQQKQEIQQAREVLREQSGNEYSQARIAALEVLNKYCQGNPGLKAPKGKMPKLKLSKCSDFVLQYWSKEKKPGMDLSYSDLKGADLSGANLQGINLRGSDLQGAKLPGANLEGADLTGAKLQNADLSRAKLKRAKLKNSYLSNSNLYGADFQHADLSKAKLQGITALWANFNHAKFHGANLESANFNRAQLIGADFYQANLEESSLRFADLSSETNKQGKQSTIGANLREAKLKGADLWGTKFWSAFQLKRAKNWEHAELIDNWKQQIIEPRLPRLRIALLKPKTHQSIFEAYELGMRRAANRRVEILGIPYAQGVEDEAKAINQLIEEKIDGIILTPEDPKESIIALKKASEAGVAITTVDFCFDRSDAEDLAIACYDTDKFEMGYDSGKQLAKWAKKNLRSQELVEVALVDEAIYERYYPYLEGVLTSINESDLDFKIKGSVGIPLRDKIEKIKQQQKDKPQVQDLDFKKDNSVEFEVAFHDEIEKVKKLLGDKDNPQVQILWGGSNLATEVAIHAVEKLKTDKVKIFGILDLSIDKVDMLVDKESPVQLIIDQSRLQVGYEAVKRTIDVLRGKCSGADYKPITIKRDLLDENSFNKRATKEELITKLQTVKKIPKNTSVRDCKSVSNEPTYRVFSKSL